jgi:hypothetical protein
VYILFTTQLCSFHTIISGREYHATIKTYLYTIVLQAPDHKHTL